MTLTTRPVRPTLLQTSRATTKPGQLADSPKGDIDPVLLVQIRLRTNGLTLRARRLRRLVHEPLVLGRIRFVLTAGLAHEQTSLAEILRGRIAVALPAQALPPAGGRPARSTAGTRLGAAASRPSSTVYGGLSAKVADARMAAGQQVRQSSDRKSSPGIVQVTRSQSATRRAVAQCANCARRTANTPRNVR
jgi:hypothetical protein